MRPTSARRSAARPRSAGSSSPTTCWRSRSRRSCCSRPRSAASSSAASPGTTARRPQVTLCYKGGPARGDGARPHLVPRHLRVPLRDRGAGRDAAAEPADHPAFDRDHAQRREPRADHVFAAPRGSGRSDLRARGDGGRGLRGRRRARADRRGAPAPARARRRQALDPARMTDVRLIQVPWYLGREHPDLSRGPGLLADAIGGDSVVVPAPEPRPVPNEIADSFDVIRSVRTAVIRTVEEGRFPLVLAVNCFTSLGTVAAVGRDVGVVWFDAHGDFNTPGSTTTGFLDGMGLAMLLGEGWDELRATIERLRPVPAENAVLVGARDLDRTEGERVEASALRRADAETLEAALDELAPRVDAVYVHIDLDVLDSSVARANVLSTEGGLDVEQLERALEAISSRFEIAAGALTAYDPSQDRESRVPEIAAILARRLVPEKVAR